MFGLNLASAVTFLGGGLVFGIALFRAKVLARWAAALLAAGSVATLFLPLLPQVNDRLFAVPIGVALIGLGYSLWSGLRTAAARTDVRHRRFAGPAGTSQVSSRTARARARCIMTCVPKTGGAHPIRNPYRRAPGPALVGLVR